ncbi:cytochrome P450 [Lentzea alba]
MTTTHPSENQSYVRGVAPGALPLLGHAPQFLRDPLDFVTSLGAHGDIVEIQLGLQPVLVACARPLANEVMQRCDVFDKGGHFYDTMKGMLGDGVGTCSWSAHRRKRQLVQPAFQRAKIGAYARVMHSEVASLVAGWRTGQTVDVSPAFYRMATRATVRALFSSDLEATAVAEIQRCFPIVWRGMLTRMLVPASLLRLVATRGNRGFDAALASLNQVLADIIRAYRTAGVDHADILSALLAAEDEATGLPLTDAELHDELMTLLVGGTETTSATLAWAFHLLAGHPEVERRLHAEVDEVLGGRIATFEDIARLEYTHRLVTETLRLYPPGWVTTRLVTADTELGGHHLAAGTAVMVSHYAIHHDPSVFPEPYRCDPDRWLPERASTIPKDAWVAFGSGRRRCLGDMFALTEITMALATIAGRWSLRPASDRPLKIQPRMFLTPGSLPMTFTARPAGDAQAPAADGGS